MAIFSNPQRLEFILNYLPANEAFGAAKVSQTFHQAQERLNASVFLHQIRPNAWVSKNKLDQKFNRRLLRDWYLCLKYSALQVAYVGHEQHLIFVEPSCTLTAAPQGSDPFPVNVDNDKYCCFIEPFNFDCLWWDCLQKELFEWPRQVAQILERRPEEEDEFERREAPEARGAYPRGLDRRSEEEDEFERREAPEARGAYPRGLDRRSEEEDEFERREAPEARGAYPRGLDRRSEEEEDEFERREAPEARGAYPRGLDRRSEEEDEFERREAPEARGAYPRGLDRRSEEEDEFERREAPEARGAYPRGLDRRSEEEDEFERREAPEARGAYPRGLDRRSEEEDEFERREAPEARGAYPSENSKPEALQEEMLFELEAVPGYQGSLDPPNLLEDVLAVLSLNAAWFTTSFWTRQLQAILLLRDCRFLLIGACEMQNTIDSQAKARVYRGFVADSLASLVTFAQDPRSREILRTRLPGEPAPVASAGVQSVNPTWMSVSIPRVEPDKAEAFHERFGSFLHASETCENVLFSTLQVDPHEQRQKPPWWNYIRDLFWSCACGS